MNAPQPLRFSRLDYHRLGESKFFGPAQRVELINGEIIEMSPKGVAHESCLRTLLRQLFVLVPDTYIIGCQSPVAVGDDSEPEPDISIAVGPESNYLGRHPNGHEILLAIEISDSTLQFDRTTKAKLYALAQIPHYWIFNVVDHCVESFSRPTFKDELWQYTELRIHTPSEQMELPLFAKESAASLFLKLSSIV